MPELICKILHIGKTTYYKYKNNNYQIINFLLKFKEDELNELLKTGNIKKLELIENYSYTELQQKLSSSNKIDSDDVYYANILYKLKDLNMREKAILYHSLQKFKPTNKDELLQAIKNIELTKILLKQFFTIFKQNQNSLDSKLGFSSDQDNLYKFITKYISNTETQAFLNNPKFD